MAKPRPSVAWLRKHLRYDPETGNVYWRFSRRGIKAGSYAGSLHNQGRWRIHLQRRFYRMTHIIWAMQTGAWPPKGMQIDHRDGDKANDVWSNLRLATPSQNKCNQRRHCDNASGFKGVHFRKDRRKYIAQIALNGRNRHLGHFDTPELAHAAYAKAAQKLHGEFARVQ